MVSRGSENFYSDVGHHLHRHLRPANQGLAQEVPTNQKDQIDASLMDK